MHLVCHASDGDEAVTLAEQAHPDVVVMDLHMPGTNGVEATRCIKAAHPSVAVLIFIMLEATIRWSRPCRPGRGNLLKEATREDSGRAIRSVSVGEAIIDHAVAGRVLAAVTTRGPARPTPTLPFPRLRPRAGILSLVARGLSKPAIAEHMYPSEKTVRKYVSTIFAKIHVTDRGAAVAAARDAGLGNNPARNSDE